VPLFGAAGLRDADAEATRRFGLPSLLLMERAGLESARAILERFPAARQAVVVVGSGNNAGDGMVVARHLSEASWRVQVISPDGLTPTATDAQAMGNVAVSLGIALGPFDPGAARPEGAVLVDALLGTGTRGAPRAPLDAMIAWAANWPGPVVALDIPSGVDADSGRVGGECITADLTVTYHGDKPGLHVYPGRQHAGEVVVVDIGIPGAVQTEPLLWLAHAAAAAGIPSKSACGEKYAAGAVLVVAGAPGLTGAGVLCAQASLRAGAGLVVAAVPATVQPLMAPMMREVMCAPVTDDQGCLGPGSVADVLAQAERTAAIALGPGIGRHPSTTDAVLRLITQIAKPVVIDADGLWHLVGHLDVLYARSAPTVLTPHAGEAARLLGCARSDVDDDRLAAALQLCLQTGATVVLKGPGTIVCGPEGPVCVARDGGPELSTAGSGDVLTGIIAAALAKRMDPTHAAIAAVCAHAAAGRLTGFGDGMVAGDLITAVPAALQEARERARQGQQ
jgi:NAD(P)H-hydrate epimerase